MGSDFTGFLSRKLASSLHSVSVYLLLPLLCFVSTCILRLQKCGASAKKNEKDTVFDEIAEKYANEFRHFRNNDKDEEKTELHLDFKFPTFEEYKFSGIQSETGNLLNSEDVPFSSTASKYEFVSGNSSLRTFFEELRTLDLRTFPVKEINGNENCDLYENEDAFSDIKVPIVYEECDEEDGKLEAMKFVEDKEKTVEDEEEFLDEFHYCPEKNTHRFLSDGDFVGESDIDGESVNIGSDSELFENEELSGHEETDNVEEEIKKLEEHQSNSDLFLSEKDFNENSDTKNDVEFEQKIEVPLKDADSFEKPKVKEPLNSDSGDSNRLESLWEHQELIEQLKMELRKVKATGLPTILEESESPKITDELKPWKIDDKVQHEDCMGELHKFYKSYTEKMRKFDILNYQKMYAMGFLHLKDPFQSTPHQKPSAPTLKSLASQNHWLFKHKSNGSDPIRKLINELQGDLEVVYVGQMCLSWEFLHWQYQKTLDLWNSDPHGIHRYNEVAGEFQQFQVLIQRFKEDEPFQGPRIQSYVKSRCVLRNLLQVPLVREDYLKDKTRDRKKDKDDYAITSEMLVEIVEESIRIFWQLIRSDKDCNTHKKMPEPHNPEDLKLLLDVRKILQKKERKLKDILRSENCIVRKLRQRKDDDSDQVLHFCAQVDMKLVSRVLNMTKITRDQLIWSQNKLSRISFVNRKMYVEPDFLLFPC